ncbi:hypothetical protein D770_20275 [Flammeovirgaceae bacterium 311]|nr:hypothetical protein D770_20275 [Flammeovirgaceae bacterium 311]
MANVIKLRDLRHQNGPIPGGVVKLYLAKDADVTNMTITTDPTTGAKSIDVDMTVGGDGFKEFEFEPGTCKLSHPTVGEDGSKSFEQLVDWVIAGDDDRLELFNNMINGRYIAITDSASGGLRVVGTKRAPALLTTATYDSGADQPERNATTFQLKSRAGHYSIKYTGAVPVVAGP